MQKLASGIIREASEQTIKNAKQVFGWQVSVVTTTDPQLLTLALYNGPDCTFFDQVVQQLPVGEYLVDTKVAMLRTGYLPCIGGWHMDEIKRGFTQEERKNITGLTDQHLNFSGTDPNLEHYLIVVDHGTGSLTEFYTREFTPKRLDDLHIYSYQDLSKFIESTREGFPEMYTTIESNTLYKFGAFEAHRGQPATGPGWRYFFRATRNSKRPVANEIRFQSQVYIPEGYWDY